ncbi:MAG TPA: hypothetical protein VMT61_11790 [Candidatus Binataceae bacterium]|nr:hypothetical protein [Candidatus Binataceae bacterium]
MRKQPLGRFFAIWRDYGSVVAARVVWSKFKGALSPSLAIPANINYAPICRDFGVLLNAADYSRIALNNLIEGFSKESRGGVEICILERRSGSLCDTLRGSQPLIRIITVDDSVRNGVAIRWTVEQATARYIALIAPECCMEVRELKSLVKALDENGEIDGVASCVANSAANSESCKLLLLRKSRFLELLPQCETLLPSACLRNLHSTGVPVAYVSEGAIE